MAVTGGLDDSTVGDLTVVVAVLEEDDSVTAGVGEAVFDRSVVLEEKLVDAIAGGDVASKGRLSLG